MTPVIAEYTRELEKANLDPTKFMWFDVSDVVKAEFEDVVPVGNGVEYTGRLTISYSDLDQPPPFPATIFIGETSQDGARYISILHVKGGDPRKGPVNIRCLRATVSDGGTNYLAIPLIAYSIDENNQVEMGWAELVDQSKWKTEHANAVIGALSMVYARMSACTSPIPAYKPVARPGLINQKRKKKGKPLFYDWVTVNIEPPKPRSLPKGGTHASPRLHDRRGHFRTLRSGRKVWVRNHKVGDASKGTVFHDYVVS